MRNTIEFKMGRVLTEQDLITELIEFMTVQIGDWSIVRTISDTSSDRDIVFTSAGTEPGRFRPIFARWRGVSNYIYVYGYTWYSSGGSYTDELHNSTYARSPATGPNRYYFFADADGVWADWYNDNDNAWYHAYIGYFDSYFDDADEDRYPLCVIGNYNDMYFFNNDDGCYLYAPWPTHSGSVNSYRSHQDQATYMLQFAQPNQRDGSMGYSPFVLYRPWAPYEVRGELKHCYQFGGWTLTNGDWVTISGTNHKYMISVNQDSSGQYWYECMGFGPILASSGTDWE